MVCKSACVPTEEECVDVHKHSFTVNSKIEFGMPCHFLSSWLLWYYGEATDGKWVEVYCFMVILIFDIFGMKKKVIQSAWKGIKGTKIKIIKIKIYIKTIFVE